MKKRVDVFEMWCYRRMLKISWKEKVSNMEVVKGVDKLHFGIDMREKIKFCLSCIERVEWRQPPTRVGR